MKLVSQVGLAVILLAISASAIAQGLPDNYESNWHRFRGPHGTGVTEGNPPTSWDQETNVQWKVELPGRGSGSPIVWGDKIFLLTAIKTDRTADSAETTSSDSATIRLASGTTQLLAQQEGPRGEDRGERRGRRGRRRGGFGGGEAPTHFHQFIVMCLDRNTGETLWQQTANEVIPHEGHHGTSSYASSSPVTDGKNLYVSFGSRGVYSYDMEGNLRWERRDLGQLRMRFGFGEGASPALCGNRLIVNFDHEGDSFIAALDAESGETVWRQSRDEESTWTSPIVVEAAGKTQVIVNATNRTRSYDLESGEVIWECGGQAQGVIPMPVVYEDTIIVMTGHRGSALVAIPLDSEGDITDSDQIAWRLDRDTPYVPSPLLYDDLLYFTKSNNAILTCLSAEDGEVVYRGQRLPEIDSVYASPVAAAGNIYIPSRDGKVVVFKHGREFEVVAINDLGETIDATPAIVDDQMIIRTERHLYCIAEE